MAAGGQVHHCCFFWSEGKWPGMKLSAFNMRTKLNQHAKVVFVSSPTRTDIDPAPGVTQAALQTARGESGNKNLLTRLFYCLQIKKNSRNTVFISFRSLASRSLTATDSNSA